jgi:P27 family predicted phage terminase small subunit
MDKRAATVWDTTLRDMAPGVIWSVDGPILRMYCEAVALWESATRIVARTGPLIRGQKGDLVKNPAAQIARDQGQIVLATARELELSPSARAHLNAGQSPAADDEFARWMRR